jgi:hypothetical protein
MLASSRKHRRRRHDQKLGRQYRGMMSMRPSDPIVPLLLQLLLEHRLAVAYTTRPLACPFAPWSALAVVDLARTSQPPLNPIKGACPWTSSSHSRTPLSLLTLLDISLLHIVPSAAVI